MQDDISLLEEEMRRALGVASSTSRDPSKVLRNPVVSGPTAPSSVEEAISTKPQTKEAEAKAKEYVKPHIYLCYSVREQWGGPTFKFDFKSDSMSVDIAKMEAEKAIRDKNLQVWFCLDVQRFN